MRDQPVQLDLLDWLATRGPCPSPAEPLPPPPALDGTGPVLLTRVDASCNMHRFYSVALATSFFGECGVVCQWGRIGSQGQRRTAWYQEVSRAEAARQKLVAQKKRRGYVPMDKL
jgi:predicted DNA-binding WGR domain protein